MVRGIRTQLAMHIFNNPSVFDAEFGNDGVGLHACIRRESRPTTVFTLLNPLNIFVQHTLPPAVQADCLNNQQHESNLTWPWPRLQVTLDHQIYHQSIGRTRVSIDIV